MPKSYYPPKNPSAQYLRNVVWLKAFLACGWSGPRAIEAADRAEAEYLQRSNKNATA